MIRVLHPNGQVDIHDVANFDFAKAKALIGGHVEVLYRGSTVYLFDEDGIAKDLPTNVQASAKIGRVLLGLVIELSGAFAISRVLDQGK